jgi:hypothetical protein
VARGLQRCGVTQSHFTPHDGCYFERAPEKLVLEGYRRWMAGYETGSVAPWETTWALYAELLGPTNARRAMGELSHFVRTLRQCAACPLRSFPFGAHHVCRDECLTLGLIAAHQHRHREAAEICLSVMSCPTRCGEVDAAAASFADTLASLDHHLLPIPASAIEDVVARATRTTIH